MRLLLDTHIYLWVVQADRRLPKAARDLIKTATEVYISSASIWEAAIKIKLKKLDADLEQLASAITESGFLELPISVKHATCVQHLPHLHRDPFDRMLIAQAMSEPLRLLTIDRTLRAYSELVTILP